MKGPDDSDQGSVGYGRPPVAKRFQKGKSGNQKGRPKGRKNIGTIFLHALYHKVDVREGDRVRSMTKIAAGIEVTLNKMLKGDLRAFAKVMDVAVKLGIANPPPDEREIHENNHGADSAFEYFARELDRLALAKHGDVKDNDAAPGCNSKPEKP